MEKYEFCLFSYSKQLEAVNYSSVTHDPKFGILVSYIMEGLFVFSSLFLSLSLFLFFPVILLLFVLCVFVQKV